MCVEGCLDPDPAPSAPGYFFPGTENTWGHCADGDLDADSDGLDDDCEYMLAYSFRPEISWVYFDNFNREPRWAAEWVDGDPAGRTVRLAYLLSYWLDIGDGGTSGTICGIAGSSACDGHLGDSEWIRLDVTYNPVTKHWYLSDAKYSAHTSHVEFNRNSNGWLYVSPASDGGGAGNARNYMEYPDGKIGGYPRSYAADGKKANYPTVEYCDGPGGLGGADECSSPRISARIEVFANANLGSRHSPFVNCVTTTRTDHPSFGAGVVECYWEEGVRFSGWYTNGAGQPTATGYSGILADQSIFGF